MRKKIFISLCKVSIIGVLLAFLLYLFIFYESTGTAVMYKLKLEAEILKQNSEITLDTGARVTIIDGEGKVLADSTVNIEGIENHNNRKEIIEAREKGYGNDIRKSNTLGKNTYYYAVKTDDGNILRVSRQASDILGTVITFFPITIFIMILDLFVCAMVSTQLSKNLIKPIEDLGENLDNIGKVKYYVELKPFINKIEETEKLRREFTSNVSHELKTPLTSIRGYGELIANDMVKPEDIKDFGARIYKESDRLGILIENIMRLSQIQEGAGLEKKDCDLYEISRDSMSLLAEKAKAIGVKLELNGEKTIIKGNKDMLQEVVYNLCDNAIKYNKQGGRVKISIEKKDHVILTVEDDGIGIGEKDLPRIFERFYRTDKSRAKATGGTGLGLAIVKHIVEYHDGEIKVESQLGKGTKIVIKI